MQPIEALQSLSANPVRFLKKYPVRIFGSIAQSGVIAFGMGNRGQSHRPGKILKTKRWHQTESFNIGTMQYIKARTGNAHNFLAHSIHMDVGQANLNFYTLPAIAGPSIMVTGQLSGCSFVISPIDYSQDVNVAHIQPAGVNGVNLRNNLVALHPHATVFGPSNQKGNYLTANNRVASMIGIRTAGRWNFYSQKQQRGGDYRVLSVWRQYPNRCKV